MGNYQTKRELMGEIVDAVDNIPSYDDTKLIERLDIIIPILERIASAQENLVQPKKRQRN